MDSSLVKRSVSIEGHRVNISIEGLFWNSLEEIARTQATTMSKLVAAIEAGRGHASLSSAIRVYVIDHFATRAQCLDDMDDAMQMSVNTPFKAARPRWLN